MAELFSHCKLEELSCRLIVAILTIFRVEQNHLTSVCIMLIEIEHIKLCFLTYTPFLDLTIWKSFCFRLNPSAEDLCDSLYYLYPKHEG